MWISKPCEIHEVHTPRPAENKVVSVAGRDVVLCPVGVHNLEVALAYMSGTYTGKALANRIGKSTWDLAQQEITFRETGRTPADAVAETREIA